MSAVPTAGAASLREGIKAGEIQVSNVFKGYGDAHLARRDRRAQLACGAGGGAHRALTHGVTSSPSRRMTALEM